LSLTFWTMGYPEQALRQITQLRALPQRLCSTFDMGQIMLVEIAIRCFLCRDYHGGREKAQAAIALARENGFSFFEKLGATSLGRIAVQQGAIKQGIDAIEQGREALRTDGAILSFHICKGPDVRR